MTLAQLKTALTAVETQIDDICKIGRSYSVDGSHSLTHEDLSNLRSMASEYRARIYRFQGHTGRIRPDFSG